MSKSMKRLTAPRSWPIPRKDEYWATKPSPGPHPTDRSMPALIVLRDMLGLCSTAAEAKRIIGNRDITVDGRPISSHKMPIGLMDVVSIPKLDQHYRMLLDRRGKFRLVKVDEKDKGWKLCRIEGKTTVKAGKVQLNLHDGRNILLDADKYATGDVLKVEVPSQRIIEAYALAKGNVAMVISGAHAGEVAVIEHYERTRTLTPNLVTFKDGTSTVKENVFVVGSKGSEIQLPEESAV